MIRRSHPGRPTPALGFAIGLVAAACSSSQQPAVPRPHYKVGAPYVVNGERYAPREDPTYQAVGLASWYGPGFDGKPTANGEIFDRGRLSAAHKTLPLPSIVRIENLDNGLSLKVRVNDRGPFVEDRVIDLSQAAARALGFEDEGLARVRVSFVGPADLKAAAPKAPSRASLSLAEAGRRPEFRPAAPPRAAARQIWVRVGPFPMREAALDAQLDLADIGPSRIRTDPTDIGDVHTLFIGPYENDLDAQAWRAAVVDAGFHDAALTPCAC